jgi:type I restriction enzyme S subunit
MTAMSETKKAALSGKYAAYPEYKDSGVEWLENIPQHWSAKPLKFLCTYNDEVINDATDNNYEIQYVDIGSVSSSTGITKTESILFSKAPSRARRIVKDGDVIISTVRTYLEAIAPINNPPSNMVVSTGFAVIRPTSELHKDFAAYCLRAKGFIKEVVARSVGVSYPAINASDLVNIPIPFVEIKEQTQIAAFLDHETAKIDTLIEKQQQLIELLKEKRQAVISHAVTKGLNPNAPMKDSGVEWLGEVPEHWDVTRAKFVASIFVPQRNKPELNETQGIAWATMDDMKNKYIEHTSNFVALDAAQQAGSKILKSGAVIASCVGNFGITSINKIDVIINQQLQAFQPHKIKAEYLQSIVSISKQYFELIGTAATLIYVNQEGFENLPVIVPPEKEQEQISSLISEQQTKFKILIDKAINSIELMQERRTALISAAVTGKIDVRHWVDPTTSSDTNETQQKVTA